MGITVPENPYIPPTNSPLPKKGQTSIIQLYNPDASQRNEVFDRVARTGVFTLFQDPQDEQSAVGQTPTTSDQNNRQKEVGRENRNEPIVLEPGKRIELKSNGKEPILRVLENQQNTPIRLTIISGDIFVVIFDQQELRRYRSGGEASHSLPEQEFSSKEENGSFVSEITVPPQNYFLGDVQTVTIPKLRLVPKLPNQQFSIIVFQDTGISPPSDSTAQEPEQKESVPTP